MQELEAAGDMTATLGAERDECMYTSVSTLMYFGTQQQGKVDTPFQAGASILIRATVTIAQAT